MGQSECEVEIDPRNGYVEGVAATPHCLHKIAPTSALERADTGRWAAGLTDN